MSNVIVQEALRGKVYRELPSANLDGSDAYARLGRYGEVRTQPLTSTKHALAEEGSYYVAVNATISTGITIGGDTQTAWVVTTPSIVLYNGASTTSTSAKSIIPDYIKMLVTSAGTAAAAFHYAVAIDTTNRWTSGGTAIVPTNVNGSISTATSAVLHVGAITAPAASANVRYTGRGVFRAAIPVANDQYILAFGASDIAASNSGDVAGTTVCNHVCHTSPVIVPPGGSLLVYTWGASMSNSPEVEFEMGYWER